MNKLSDGEWKLMELLWEESPVNSTRLVERCRERLTWSKSTTYTVLRRLCRNAAVDHLRSAQRHSAEALDETRPDPAPGPEEQLLRKERAERLERALASLSRRDRALFYRK